MKRILIVEHSERTRDLLSRRLAARGLQVEIAEGGHEALSVAETVRPDLILMELAMPVFDGWECLRRLKANPTTRHIPIVALATRTRANDRERALKAGFEEFDTKPVDFDKLLLTMDRLLQVAV